MQHEEVIISGTPLDVPSDNYEEFDQEIDPAKLGEKLEQENTLKGTVREFQLYANSHLLLNVAQKKKVKNYRVNLAWLSSEPEHVKIAVWKWLYAALASAAIMLLFIYFAFSEIVRLDYCLVAGTITLTATLIFSLIFMYFLRDEYVFKSYFGNVSLFTIENRRPAQQVFDSYYINMQQIIDRAQSNLPVSERLLGELKMCRRLRDEGILDDETYTRARTAIFKHEQYKA